MKMLTTKMFTPAALGLGIFCLASLHPLWAQGGASPDSNGLSAIAGIGNQLTDPLENGLPGDYAGFADNGAETLQQAYRNYNVRRFPLAASELQAILKVSPNTVEAHEMLADIYLKQNQVARAIPELEAIVRLQPKDSIAQSDLGTAYLQNGEAAKAAQLFQAAFLQNPKNRTYAFQYALALEKDSQHAAAAAAFEKAAALDPKDSRPSLYAGLLYHQVGEDAKAVPALKKALVLGTADKFDAYTALAEAAAADNQDNDAINDYAQAVRAKPDDFADQANLGVLDQNTGKSGEAEAAYRRALTLKTDDRKSKASIQADLAMLLTDTGNFGEAVTLLTLAMQGDPSNAFIEDNFGRVYEKQGEEALALSAYKKALVLDPADDLAVAGVSRLSKQ